MQVNEVGEPIRLLRPAGNSRQAGTGEQFVSDATAVRKGDQARALWLSTIAFTVCFAVWTIFSIIGVQIKKDLGLNETAVRPAGRHADPDRLADPPDARHLDRPVRRPHRLHRGDAVGGGRDLAADLRLRLPDVPARRARRRHRRRLVRGRHRLCLASGIRRSKQGTALGIFGAGNVGAAVTKFVAPFVMVAYGWQAVAQVWAIGDRRDGGRLLVRDQGRPAARGAARRRRASREPLSRACSSR